MIYFDNAATTRMYPEVFEAMKPWLAEQYANPSAEYPFGGEARKAVEQARKDIADTLDTTPDHIIFTSGGTEGNNTVLKNTGWYCGSEMEHPSVYNIIHRTIKNSKAGMVQTRHIQNADADLSVMWVNNEIGVVNDIVALSRAHCATGHRLHTDAVQGYGVFDSRPIAAAVDYMTVSAHKFHGPKGVGFIYAYDPICVPLLDGGGQEYGQRSGTENVAGIVGMAKAARIADRRIQNGDFAWLKNDYADYIREKLAPVADRFNGDSRKIVSVTLKDVTASSMVLALGEQDICISSGSACHANSDKPSRVLKAIGLSDDEARRTIRISIGDDTTADEVYALVWAVKRTREVLLGESAGI